MQSCDEAIALCLPLPQDHWTGSRRVSIMQSTGLAESSRRSDEEPFHTDPGVFQDWQLICQVSPLKSPSILLPDFPTSRQETKVCLEIPLQ